MLDQPGMADAPGETVAKRVGRIEAERIALRKVIDAGTSTHAQRQRWVDLGVHLAPFAEAARIKARADALAAKAAGGPLSLTPVETDELASLARKLTREYKGMV